MTTAPCPPAKRACHAHGDTRFSSVAQDFALTPSPFTFVDNAAFEAARASAVVFYASANHNPGAQHAFARLHDSVHIDLQHDGAGTWTVVRFCASTERMDDATAGNYAMLVIGMVVRYDALCVTLADDVLFCDGRAVYGNWHDPVFTLFSLTELRHFHADRAHPLRLDLRSDELREQLRINTPLLTTVFRRTPMPADTPVALLMLAKSKGESRQRFLARYEGIVWTLLASREARAQIETEMLFIPVTHFAVLVRTDIAPGKRAILGGVGVALSDDTTVARVRGIHKTDNPRPPNVTVVKALFPLLARRLQRIAPHVTAIQPSEPVPSASILMTRFAGAVAGPYRTSPRFHVALSARDAVNDDAFDEEAFTAALLEETAE